MQQTQPLQKFTRFNISSFELTKRFIEKAESIELSATATSVVIALLYHYNPKNKYVFPHQETIAKRIKRSVTTVKRALTEIKNFGFLVTCRSRNGNLYAFTKKFFDMFELSESESCTVSKVQNELCMNHEHVKEQKNQHNVVAFKSKNHKTVTLDDVPELIKKNKKIDNPCGYWFSLSDEVKNEYRTKQKIKDEKIRKKLELEKQEEVKKELERKELEKIKNEPPFWQTCSRMEAINHLKCFLNMPKLLNSGYRLDLIKKFNIDVKNL